MPCNALTHRKRIVVAALAIILAFVIGGEFRYPPTWNEVHLNMSRDEVYQLADRPSYSMGDIKGDFWLQDGLFVTAEMHVYFDGDRATNLYIIRRVGTKEHFLVFGVRDEFLPLEHP